MKGKTLFQGQLWLACAVVALTLITSGPIGCCPVAIVPRTAGCNLAPPCGPSDCQIGPARYYPLHRGHFAEPQHQMVDPGGSEYLVPQSQMKEMITTPTATP